MVIEINNKKDNEDIIELTFDAKKQIKKLPTKPVFAEKRKFLDILMKLKRMLVN